jgi:hypothetical protein
VSYKPRLTAIAERPPERILIYILATLSYMTLGLIVLDNIKVSGKILGVLLVHQPIQKHHNTPKTTTDKNA